MARMLRKIANHIDPLIIVDSGNNIIGFAMEDVIEGQAVIAVMGSLKVAATSDVKGDK